MPIPERPTIRPIDVRRIRHNDSDYFLLRDPLRVAEQQLLVPAHFAPILARMDGSATAAEIVAAIEADHGVRVSPAIVNHVAEVLDEAFLLESGRFHAQLHAVTLEYRSAPFRTPALAGSGYPAEPAELWDLFQEALEQADDTVPAAVEWDRPVGLLSPHIDYERGNGVYARVWKRSAQAVAEADLVVVFATDHHGDDAFTLTRQSYATPYGILPTATTIVDRLAAAVGEEAVYAGELRHRGEHSLELVLTWLHHMRGGQPVEVLPILVGSLSHYLRNGASPRDDATIEQVLAILRTEMQNRRVLVVASGDLAHVGPAFGQPALTPAARERVRAEDKRILAELARGDADGFYRTIKRVGNRYNVCGVTPIYLTMRLLGAQPGEEVGYGVCPADEHDTSAVTVAGVLFHAGAR